MNKVLWNSIAVSLALHASAVTMAKEGKLPGFFVPEEQLLRMREKQSLMNFQFVDSPATQLKDERPSQKSNLISDKSTVAKDKYDGPSPAATQSPRVEKPMPGKQVGRLEGEPEQPLKMRPSQPMRKAQPPAPAKQEVLKAEPVEETSVKPQTEEERKKLEYLEKIKELQQKIDQAQRKIKENEELLRRKRTEARQEEEDLLREEKKQQEQQQDQESSRGKVGLGGSDLHGNASDVQGDVDRFGEISFNAERYALGGYFRKLKRKVEEYWLPYLAFTYSGGNIFGNTTVVFFKIMPDGKVKDVKVLKHAGDELLKEFCLSSVQANSPFDRLPDDFLKNTGYDYLPVVFTFNY